MSEKEIINKLKYSQQQMRLGNLPDYNQEHYKCIEGLIDLYNEEKEKNEELEKQIQLEIEGRNILVGLNENLKEELKEEKEKNRKDK